MLKKFNGLIAKNWDKLVQWLVFALVFSLLYLYKLGSYVRSDSIYETTPYLEIVSVNEILRNISLAPIKFAEFGMTKIDEGNATLLRLVSALTIGAALVIFYKLINEWHTRRTAIITTLLFASSAFLLNSGRFTIQDSIYFALIPALLLIGTWLKAKKSVNKIFYALPICALLLYLPGTFFILLILALVFRKRLKVAWRFSNDKLRILGFLSLILILVPLFYGLYLNSSQALKLLGVNRLVDYDAMAVFDKFINIPSELFWSGINEPYRWLFGTPIIDIVAIVFAVIGFYAYTKSVHTLRARLLFGLFLSCIVVVSLSTVATVAIIIPVVYIYVANGVAFMLQNWFAVFPRNPAARNVGVIILAIPLLLSAGYNLEKYFIAWGDSPVTIEALSKK